MKFIADLHIHSHRSLATSKESCPEGLAQWARIKGIQVVGTGDCVHPGYYAELQEKLEPAGNGLYRLRKEYRSADVLPQTDEPYFILTTELSSIYKKNGSVRKIHNLVVFPDFESAAKVQRQLAARGANITSDGRPILGIDAKEILARVLESGPMSFLIPAHIWTPWFSVLGARSGFDRIEECFEDLTEEIFALETGLSSDPPMNRRCSFLDRFRLVSNSDAHSPNKLGREANIFDTELSYRGMYEALKYDRGFAGTIEFFPQEGKYHYDGHRNCAVCFDPAESRKHNGICPVCGKKLTMGVATRVAALADRDKPVYNGSQTFYSITSLPDVLAEVLGKKSTTAKKVKDEYARLIGQIGPEFTILLDAEEDLLRQHGGDTFALAISRLRAGAVRITEGYDGVFGSIKALPAADRTTGK